jgi:hypothetical protein
MSRSPSTTRRKLTPEAALRRLRVAFRTQLGLGTVRATTLLTGARLYDKAYELSCLLRTMHQLQAIDPAVSFQLQNGTRLAFRGKGGPIQRGTWPYIEMRSSSVTLAEIWVDIECHALSAWMTSNSLGYPPYGRAHELDVVVVAPGASGTIPPDQLYIGIEAKHRMFTKALLKELLGIRRETAFKGVGLRNDYAWWRDDRRLPADPPSGIVLFCSSNNVTRYTDPAEFWGIEMIHHPF